MSSVDQRVVEMRFDNDQFERGVHTSLGTLDKLKAALKFKTTVDSLKGVNKSAATIDFSSLLSATDVVTNRLSALGIMGVTALQRITNAAIDTGQKMLSALTIDPIKTGFQEYETQMNAVQTILANTQSKGRTLDDVNRSLNDLNVYADKTIYNFTEMTKNIGRFTAAGMDLEPATSAIKGIANLAAVSGSTSQQASNAMYQLSQALASGTVNLQDWNSVVNAGMGGQIFQDALKRTAKHMGKVIDESKTFRESISSRGGSSWLDGEVLQKTLQQLSGDLTEAQLKTEGYTDTEVKEILKLAKTASDAATVVKTFSQLWDTLKESAQSTWTQSWQYVIGDFNEAKTLLTDVNRAVSGFIERSGSARNELLKFWHDMGGRMTAIYALKNIFKELGKLFGTVGQAFREIFPPMSGYELVGMTIKFRQFTQQIQLSETTLNNIKSTFKGFFAVIDIGLQFVKALAHGAFELIKAFLPVGDGILGVTGSFGEYLAQLDETLKKTDFFRKAINKLVSFLTGIPPRISQIFQTITGTSVGDALRSVGNAVTNGIEAVKKAFAGFGDTDTSGIDKLAANTEKRLSPIGKLFNGFLKLLGGVWEGLKTFGKMLEPIISALGDTIGSIGDGMKKAFQGASFRDVLDIVNGGILASIGLAIKKFIDGITGTVSSGGGVLDGLKDILDGVGGCLETWQKNLKVKSLLSIAAAIGIITGSLVVLASIDSEALSKALGAMTGEFLELMGALNFMSKLTPKSDLLGMASALLVLSIAVGVLSGALENLAKLKLEELVKGLLGVGALLAMLTKVATTLSTESGRMMKGSAGLIALAIALRLLVKPVKELSQLSWKELVKGLGAVGVLLFELAGSTALLSKFDSVGVNKGLGLIAFAASIIILAKAVKMFSDLSIDQMIQGLVGVSAVLLETAMFVNVAGDAKHIMATGVAMVILASSMLIFQKAVAAFGSMGLKELAKGLGAVGAAMAIAAIGVNAMNGALAGAAAMLVVAAAFAILTPQILAFSRLDIGQALMGIGVFAAVLGTMAGITLLLAPVGPILLAVGAAIALIGVGCLTAGGGVLMFTTALASLIAMGAGAVAAVGALLAAFIGAIPQFIVAVAEGIIGVIKAIGDAAPTIMEAVRNIGTSVLITIGTLVPLFVETVALLIRTMLATIARHLPSIIKSGADIIVAILEGIAKNIGRIVTAAVDIMVNFLKAITDNLPKVIQAGFDLVIGFVNGVADGIRNNTDALVDAFRNLFDACVQAAIKFLTGAIDQFLDTGREIMDSGLLQGIADKLDAVVDKGREIVQNALDGIKEKFDDVVTAGADFVNGFINGIGGAISNVWNAAAEVGKNAIAALRSKDGIDSNSPSKKAIAAGEDFDAGFQEGIEENAEGIYTAASFMGSKSVQAFAEAVKSELDITKKFEEKFDVTTKDIIENLGSQVDATEKWARRMALLGEMGIDQGIMEKLKSMGVEGLNYVNAFIMDSEASFNEAGQMFSEALTEPANAVVAVTGEYAQAAKASAEVVKEAIDVNESLVESTTKSAESVALQLERAQISYDKMKTSLTEVINSQMDIFSEFSTESDITSETLINNMGSQLSGIKSWASNITELADKGINEGLLAQLRDMGPKGLAYVQAFNQMTSEELANYNDMYAESMTIADTTAAQIAESFATAGSNASIGFKNGIAQYNANAEAASLGDAAWVNLCVSLAEHSPSQKTYEAGMNFVLGFANGVTGYAPQANAAVTTFGYGVIEFLQTTLNAERFKEIGDSIGTGLEQGISESLERVKTMIEGAGFAESFVAIGASLVTSISTGISSATETVNAAIVTLVSNINISLANQNGVFMAAGTSLMTSLNTGMNSMSGALNSTGTSLMNSVVTTLNGFQFKYQDSGHKLIEKVIQGFKDRLNQLVNMAKQLATQANKTISDFQPQFLQTGHDLIDRLIDGFNDKESTVVDTSNKIGTSAQNAFNSQYDGFFRCGQYMIEGLDRGISSMENVIFEHLRRIAEEALDAAEEELEVESPSKKFFRLGRFVMMGWINGIDDLADRVPESLSGVANKSVRTVADAIAKVGKVASGELNLDPTIRPVLDLSGIRSGIGEMDSIFDARRSVDLAVNGIDTEAMNRTKPLVIYLNNTTTLDGEPIAQSVNKILGEAL